MTRRSDKEEYYRSYPHIKKWINQCVICQAEGYKPKLPNKIEPGLMAENIRLYWNELELNDTSICVHCSKHMGE